MNTIAIWKSYYGNKPLPKDWEALTPMEILAKYICPAVLASDDKIKFENKKVQ